MAIAIFEETNIQQPTLNIQSTNEEMNMGRKQTNLSPSSSILFSSVEMTKKNYER